MAATTLTTMYNIIKTFNDKLWAKIKTAFYTKTETDNKLAGKAASSHTHNYAGSATAGGAATSANKLNTDKGSATQPVYFSGGVPVACSYELNKSVPSNADFNDTKYTLSTGDSNGQIKVTPSSGSAYNVSVKGVDAMAYAPYTTNSASISCKKSCCISTDTDSLSSYWCKFASWEVGTNQYEDKTVTFLVKYSVALTIEGQQTIGFSIVRVHTRYSTVFEPSLTCISCMGSFDPARLRLYYSGTGKQAIQLWADCKFKWGNIQIQVLSECNGRKALEGYECCTLHNTNFSTVQTFPSSTYIEGTGIDYFTSIYRPTYLIDSNTNITHVVSGAPIFGTDTTLALFRTRLTNLKSMVGSINTGVNGWDAIISARHRNGISDGNNYGFYIRTALTSAGNLIWDKQYGATAWQGERTILDSGNYSTILPSYIKTDGTNATSDGVQTMLFKLPVKSSGAPSVFVGRTGNATTYGEYSYNNVKSDIIGSITNANVVSSLGYIPERFYEGYNLRRNKNVIIYKASYTFTVSESVCFFVSMSGEHGEIENGILTITGNAAENGSFTDKGVTMSNPFLVDKCMVTYEIQSGSKTLVRIYFVNTTDYWAAFFIKPLYHFKPENLWISGSYDNAVTSYTGTQMTVNGGREAKGTPVVRYSLTHSANHIYNPDYYNYDIPIDCCDRDITNLDLVVPRKKRDTCRIKVLYAPYAIHENYNSLNTTFYFNIYERQYTSVFNDPVAIVSIDTPIGALNQTGIYLLTLTYNTSTGYRVTKTIVDSNTTSA